MADAPSLNVGSVEIIVRDPDGNVLMQHKNEHVDPKSFKHEMYRPCQVKCVDADGHVEYEPAGLIFIELHYTSRCKK